MKDELDVLCRWQAEGTHFALATVTATSRSAPREVGSAMAVDADGAVVGSVSGGCVEAALVDVARAVLSSGAPQQVAYGISDDEAIAVGLTCGGTIEVFVRPCTPESVDLQRVANAVDRDLPVAVVTIIEHRPRPELTGRSLVVTDSEVHGHLGDDAIQYRLVAVGREVLSRGVTQRAQATLGGERPGAAVDLLVEAFPPRPRLIVFGAIDFARAVTSIAAFLGYRVTICDARAVFATSARFPDADEVVVEWPHRYLAATPVDDRTALCVLTHDPKFDVPVLREALSTAAHYIGVLGSRRTHDDRLARLRDAGVSDGDLERLRSPVGLDLGGRTPQETAVAIAAELIMVQRGGSGVPLRDTSGPIHREPLRLP